MGTSKNYPSAALPTAAPILTYNHVRSGCGFAGALHPGSFVEVPGKLSK